MSKHDTASQIEEILAQFASRVLKAHTPNTKYLGGIGMDKATAAIEKLVREAEIKGLTTALGIAQEMNNPIGIATAIYGEINQQSGSEGKDG